jgi:hypothetical protein
MICESNELLAGLKNLFADSDADEQVRLMTIAPKEWGRQKNRKMMRILSSLRSIFSYFFNQMLVKTLFTYQVSIKAKSGSTIAGSSKKKWNTSLSTMSTRK